ncbi:MAG: sulfur carrier protein ThiS [Candidatus Dormibacteria bacterium]
MNDVAQTERSLVVNGDVMPIGTIASLGALLEHLAIAPERVVVELNGTIYRRGEGLDQAVREGDVVEIVHFVGGG